jgi:hypothetical protein
MGLVLFAAILLSVTPSFSAMSNPTSTEPTPQTINPELLGMVVRDPWYEVVVTATEATNEPNRAAQERMGATLAQMGVRWVRFEFHIDGTRPVEPQIARNDFFINEVAPRYGFKVLGLLGFGLLRDVEPYDPTGNDTRALTYPGSDDPLYGGGVNDYMRTWLDRARSIVSRYQGNIAAYEILNEQNRLPSFGGTGYGIPPEVAARLHTKFYRFFRHVDRERDGNNNPVPPGQSWRDAVKIIIGGLHPAGTLAPGSKFGEYISDLDYVRRMYASDGFQGYKNDPNLGNGQFPTDGLGYHPYPVEIERSVQTVDDLIDRRLQLLRETLVSVGDGLSPFWITELGYNVAYGRQNEQGQAEFLRETFTRLAVRGDVATLFWFKYEDFPPAESFMSSTGFVEAQKWGVVRIPFTEDARCPGGACYAADGNPILVRPSFYVYRELAGLPVYRQWLPNVAK